MREIKLISDISILTYMLFLYELNKDAYSHENMKIAKEKSLLWMEQPCEYCFNNSPRDYILSGNGDELKELLNSKLGL